MTEQVTQEPGLTLQDIAAALQVIDVCVQRGAIRGEELSAVGTVRDRFAAFLKAAQAEQQAEAGEEEAPAAEEEAAE